MELGSSACFFFQFYGLDLILVLSLLYYGVNTFRVVVCKLYVMPYAWLMQRNGVSFKCTPSILRAQEVTASCNTPSERERERTTVVR
jgi:hypothetical protein